MSKTKTKPSENGESETLPAVQPDREKLVAELSATKRALLERKKSSEGAGAAQQREFLAKYGPCDRVTHDHVEAVARIMGQLAVIRQRFGSSYGDRPSKFLDGAIAKLAETQGLLTAVASASMAQTLFPDRYESRHDDYDAQIQEIDAQLRQLKSKKLDPDELEGIAEDAQTLIEESNTLLEEAV